MKEGEAGSFFVDVALFDADCSELWKTCARADAAATGADRALTLDKERYLSTPPMPISRSAREPILRATTGPSGVRLGTLSTPWRLSDRARWAPLLVDGVRPVRPFSIR